MGRFVIVAYRPKPRCEQRLVELVARHLRVLAQEGLITDREGCVMHAENGTIVEVFEWLSADAIDRAHGNPVVGALWDEFAQVCDYVPLATLPESARLFAEFEAVRAK